MHYGQEDSLLWVKISLEFNHLDLINSNYCIKGNVNVCLIFPNLPNGFETGTIKTLSLIIFVGMVWQTVFADDDVSEYEFSVCVKI